MLGEEKMSEARKQSNSVAFSRECKWLGRYRSKNKQLALPVGSRRKGEGIIGQKMSLLVKLEQRQHSSTSAEIASCCDTHLETSFSLLFVLPNVPPLEWRVSELCLWDHRKRFNKDVCDNSDFERLAMMGLSRMAAVGKAALKNNGLLVPFSSFIKVNQQPLKRNTSLPHLIYFPVGAFVLLTVRRQLFSGSLCLLASSFK